MHREHTHRHHILLLLLIPYGASVSSFLTRLRETSQSWSHDHGSCDVFTLSNGLWDAQTLVVRASQNNPDLTYDVDPDIPDQLVGDSLRLRQGITNLVENAIKFAPSKAPFEGHVVLSTQLLSRS
jgi:signal transduction histidine kinase